jgi:hypothetical protein
LARLQQLLEQLREQGVGVIAGKYVRRSLSRGNEEDDVSSFTPTFGKSGWWIKTEFILCLHLVSAEKQEGDIQIEPGKPLDRLLEEARRKNDDEIPF